jgi:hypothetical protein
MCNVKIRNEYFEYDYNLNEQGKIKLILDKLKENKYWSADIGQSRIPGSFEISGDLGYYYICGDLVTEKNGNTIAVKCDSDDELKRFLLNKIPTEYKKYFLNALFGDRKRQNISL